MKQVEIKNKYGEKMVGELHKGIKDKLIIICHGYKSSKDHPANRGIAEGLNKRGWPVFRFDFSGAGDSEGKSTVMVNKQVEDLETVINYFRNKYKAIILMGGSLGAIPATIATARSKDTAGLVTINGFFGSHKLGPMFKKNYYGYRLLTVLVPKFRSDYVFFKEHMKPENISVPTLVIYTERDEIVDFDQSIDFYSRLTTRKELARLPLYNHDITGKGDATLVVEKIDKWL
jgi:alpha-beta hydrolase superfamily lysophospholipase